MFQTKECRQPILLSKNISSNKFTIDNKVEILTCEFSGTPNPSKIWITPHNFIVYFNFPETTKNLIDEHFRLTENRTISDLNAEIKDPTYSTRFKSTSLGDLMIFNISRHDSGPYQCIGLNEFGNDSSHIPVILDTQFLYETKHLHDLLGCSIIAAFLLITLCVKAIVFLCRR